MAQGQYEGKGDTFDKALHDASEKAKPHGKGWYRVVEIQVDVEDSIHDYKVILAPVT